ncbi:hypothetical protein CA264_16750 [Pontibacter actiniarum]|uniref:DUF4595 domain-containing protein n=2 Tax=Pontibacter actiniarum TaxID=323450 RepID=A0A1X9YVS9_9BACT|nr:hypothetical protein CA264_16750 [Pontibacter actiniarum]
MITKKVTALALCCLALFASCSKDNEDTQKLESELAAEKSKTVVDIKKEGEQLIIVYSNGTTASVPYTEAIKGSIGGQNGQDGVGIESITYNPETAVLAITLTNGEVTEFKISGAGADWTAVLVGDSNGSLFISEVLLGSVPVIRAEYNDSYQLTYLESNQAVDMQTRKAFDLTKSYANGTLDKYVQREYALSGKVNYTSESAGGEYVSTVSFLQYRDSFIESNGDGSYSYYYYEGSTHNGNGQVVYNYRKYGKCILVPAGEPEYSRYEISRKKSDTEFELYNNFRSTSEYSLFTISEIITINSNTSAGSVVSTKVVDVDTDAQGRVTKAYEASSEGGVATKYSSYEYNAAGLVKTTKTYSKNAQGAWVATGAFETYNYNASNRLISTVRTLADGTTREVQKASYDKNGNPTEIWAWQPAVRDYRWETNPETGERGYMVTIREAGLYKVAMIEYNYTFKNFLGNTITALVPELEGYKIVNAIKRVTTPNSYSFANIEYKEFNEFGYPQRMQMDAADAEGGDYGANFEVLLNYKVKSK